MRHRAKLNQTPIYSNFTFGKFLLWFLTNIMSSCDLLEACQVILNNFEPTPTVPNITFGQLFKLFGTE